MCLALAGWAWWKFGHLKRSSPSRGPRVKHGARDMSFTKDIRVPGLSLLWSCSFPASIQTKLQLLWVSSLVWSNVNRSIHLFLGVFKWSSHLSNALKRGGLKEIPRESETQMSCLIVGTKRALSNLTSAHPIDNIFENKCAAAPIKCMSKANRVKLMLICQEEGVCVPFRQECTQEYARNDGLLCWRKMAHLG